MLTLDALLEYAVEKEASDIFISVGIPPSIKVRGEIIRLEEDNLSPIDAETLVRALFDTQDEFLSFREKGEKDFSISRKNVGRFRVSAFMQRGSFAAVLRVIRFEALDIEKLHIPKEVLRFTEEENGLILITGATGTGKSTTISALIDLINENYNYHIITLEDPIEYLHRHKKSIVNQREVGIDTKDYAIALRSALRESPDLIFIGEMRDRETMEIALTAAETGHLVMSTLHTATAATTINRIVDVFPSEQQQQVRIQLSTSLRGIVAQQLINSQKSGLIPAFEVLRNTVAVRNKIKLGENIEQELERGLKEGMLPMDKSLANLVKSGLIERKEAEGAARNSGLLDLYLNAK